MSSERYVGEQRALWHFLSELRPLVVEALGEDALLRHHIDRALKSGDLERLRQARRMFHNHPDELKRELMRGIFEGTASGEELPAKMTTASVDPSADGREAGPVATGVIRFDAYPATPEQDTALSAELVTGERGAPVQVLIEPGTLPRSAAESLRQVADWIEHDRRVLSRHHWTENGRRQAPADETVDLA